MVVSSTTLAAAHAKLGGVWLKSETGFPEKSYYFPATDQTLRLSFAYVVQYLKSSRKQHTLILDRSSKTPNANMPAQGKAKGGRRNEGASSSAAASMFDTSRRERVVY
jgi:hypothetical protein